MHEVIPETGAPGWLSRLCICLLIRSWSQGSGVLGLGPHGAPCSVRSLLLPLPLLLPLVMLSLSLLFCQRKKERRNRERRKERRREKKRNPRDTGKLVKSLQWTGRQWDPGQWETWVRETFFLWAFLHVFGFRTMWIYYLTLGYILGGSGAHCVCLICSL